MNDVTAPEFQASQLRFTMACNQALEAHRALRNLAAVEFELKPDEQCLDDAQACLDAAVAIVQTQQNLASSCEGAPVVLGFDAEVRDGCNICVKLQKRLDTVKARTTPPP
jgi:hypothetical protein